MRTSFLFLTFASALTASAAGFEEIFNGRDLDGWAGLPEFWSVEDGAITGRTTPENPVAANTFLVWEGGKPGDFELRFEFRLLADNERASANSGVQYRSRVLDASTFVVGGYQADIDFAGKYIGMLYEEKGRGIVMQPGERIRIGASTGSAAPPVERIGEPTPAAQRTGAYRQGQWNEMVIHAQGNVLRHFLNGVLTAEVIDEDEGRRAANGVLALQLHRGPPMTVQFKNVRLKALP